MSTPPAIAELLGIVTADDLFTEDEARALLRSVTAKNPDDLPDNIGKVVTWARNVRSKVAVLDVILKLGAHEGIDVRPAAGGDIQMRLNPEMEFSIHDEGS